ncbi:MAG: ribonuclease R, partial [Marinilabiliales bacterium]
MTIIRGKKLIFVEENKEYMTKKKKKKSNSGGMVYNKKTLTKAILASFTHNSQKTYNYKQLAKLLGVKDEGVKSLITTVLYELKKLGVVEEIYAGKFKMKSQAGYIIGRIDLTRNGAGFLISEESEADIYISQENLNHALSGDEVKVYVYENKKGKHSEGEVVEILNRTRTTFVGTIETSKNFAFLVSDQKVMPYDIFIPNNALNGAKNGHKAVVRIKEWPGKSKNPEGEVIQILGYAGNNETEMHAILAEFELPADFPEEIELMAQKISADIPESEIKKRKDFRKITTFTIDPADAKDFDDALSVEFIDEETIRVGVHIADVTHYVKEGSDIDNEAFFRGTSVYLVDRVVPMLPEHLSNFICSLRPNEEKLCYSAVFDIELNGDVKHEWFGITVI